MHERSGGVAWLAVGVFALSVALGCRGTEPPPRDTRTPMAQDPFVPRPRTLGPAPHRGREGRTDSGRFEVSWSAAPDPIPLNAPFAVVARLTPVPDGATVAIDAGMPGHGHGMTVKPPTVAREDGTHESRGMLFHMPGEWELTVSVARDGEGEPPDVARFAVVVSP